MILKVLVTGADGQLAKTIHKLYNENTYNINFSFVTKNELDISNQNQVHAYLKKHSFDYCINCAAYTNVEQAEKTPEQAFKVNAEGVKYLAEACNLTSTILIHMSTDYVFDGKKETPYTEQDTPTPINEYGKSKLLGENYIQEILEKYVIIRTSWLYSKEFGHNFYKTILQKAHTETELHITNLQTGCPTDAVNLSKYIIDLIAGQTSNFGVKHFCDTKAMTWFDFAQQILKENKLQDKINLVKAQNYHTFAKRPKNSVLLCSK